MQKFTARFDEFFKSAFKSFFEVLGYKVESEFEIFKLPKRLDILVIKLEELQNNIQFETLEYFSEHNLISYKSPKDSIRRSDFNDAIIYLHGYINMTKKASYKNCTMTILCNHTPVSYLKENQELISKEKSGFWVINYGAFQIHLININLIKITKVDSAFLADFGDTKIFRESLVFIKKSKLPKKILDILNYYSYIRITNFEKEKFEEVKMPITLEADITEFAKPIYSKGKLEGKLEIAKQMKKLGSDIEFIIQASGLSKAELKKNNII